VNIQVILLILSVNRDPLYSYSPYNRSGEIQLFETMSSANSTEPLFSCFNFGSNDGKGMEKRVTCHGIKNVDTKILPGIRIYHYVFREAGRAQQQEAC
jgi:hypothetical protein